MALLPVPGIPESGSIEGDFWELHRQLGECYARDVQPKGEAKAPTPQALTIPDMPGSRRHSRARLSNISGLSASVSGFGAQSFGLSSHDMPAIPPNVRVEELRGRRKQTMRSLAGRQGMGLDDSEEVNVKMIDLKMHECWKVKKPTGKQQAGGTNTRRMSVEFAAPQTTVASTAEMEKSHGGFNRCVLHPGGLFRTVWNLMVALCVLHDLVLIPLSAFDLVETTLLSVLQWLVLLSWDCDLVVSLLTGFYDNGTLVMVPTQIWIHYAKTWMIFDLSLITLDWTLVALGGAGPERDSDQWQTLRLLRSLRLVRMLRMIKLRRAHEAFQEMLHSQASSLYFGLVSSLGYLLVRNHFIACGWFAVSHLDSQVNWVLELGLDSQSVAYQYLTCMNWAFAQLGVGSSSAKPVNSLEMGFCILIAFRSLMTSATLISTVSNLMAGLSKIKEDENTEFRLLRCYLKQNDIPQPLSQKVTQFLQHQYSLRQEARSADMEVPVLTLLSKQLQGELQFARYHKALCQLQVVHDLDQMRDLQVLQVMQRMSRTAISNTVVASKDVIFLAGAEAKAAYFTQSGSLTYFHDDGQQTVDCNSWIAEVCIWTPWVYMGDLVAEDVSRLAILDVDEFCETLGASWMTQNAARRYAEDFLENMRKQTTWTDIVKVNFDEDDSVEAENAAEPLGFWTRLFGRRLAPRLRTVVPKEPEELS